MTASMFSPAQCLGYLAFVLGVAGFLQKSDHRLKVLIASESLVYVLHFWLLGVPPASASALITAVRTALSLRLRAAWLSVLFVAIHIGAGLTFAKTFSGGAGDRLLPVHGGRISDARVAMRLMMLLSTAAGWRTTS